MNVVVTGGQMADIGSGLDYYYSWNTGNPDDTLSGISVSPSVTTEYIITVTDFCQDVVSDTVQVIIF